MKRRLLKILKRGVSFAVIVAIIVLAAQNYDSSSEDSSGLVAECRKSIENAEFRGMTEQDKIQNLGACINVVYGENLTVSGAYNRQFNSADYDVDMRFERPRTPQDYNALKDKEREPIGALVITAAKLFIRDMKNPEYKGAGVQEISVTVSGMKTAGIESESDSELFYESAIWLQPERERKAFFFDRNNMEKMAKEDNFFNWELYSLPLGWDEKYRGIGAVGQTQQQLEPQASEPADTGKEEEQEK